MQKVVVVEEKEHIFINTRTRSHRSHGPAKNGIGIQIKMWNLQNYKFSRGSLERGLHAE